MATILWICGMYFFAAVAVYIAERVENYQMRDLLPPPDRSTEREINTAERLNRNTLKNAREG